MSTETPPADTEGLEPGPTEAYAWVEADDEPTEAAEELIPRGGNGLVVAVAVLAAVACVVAVAAAVLMLARPTPRPERHYVIRPPVEVVPPPAPKPPPVTTTVTAAPPPVAQPPAPAPLTASEKFDLLLERDGMYSAGTPAENDYRGRQVCQAVANGADPDRLAAGGDDVDPAHGRLAVYDAIKAYCPQYG